MVILCLSYRLHFEYSSGPMEEKSVGAGPTVKEVIEFESHVIPSRGPYPFVQPKRFASPMNHGPFFNFTFRKDLIKLA